MANKENQDKKSLTWKLIIASGVLVSLFVGISTIDNRFAKSDQLNILETHIEKNINNKLLLAEAETVKTFEIFQMQQSTMNKTLQLQILNVQKDSIEKQYWLLKSQLRKDPNDIELQQDFEDIKKQSEDIKEKIDIKILKK